ncbi:hypothetical protein M8J76_009166 [Diaphorina citri]|nr:hypothetical protein M8J76_009166 [Diaphorina citri]
MTLPSSEVKKPLTPPKPLGISTTLPRSKQGFSESKSLAEKQMKIKPPLLPKPTLKSKSIICSNKAVINSSNNDNTDLVVASKNGIVGCTEKHTKNEEESVDNHKINEHNGIVNKMKISQNNKQQTVSSCDNLQNHNINFNSKMEIFNEIIHDSSKTKSVNHIISSNDNLSCENSKNVSTKSRNTVEPCSDIFSNIDIKSRKEKFENVNSKTKETEAILEKSTDVKNKRTSISSPRVVSEVTSGFKISPNTNLTNHLTEDLVENSNTSQTGKIKFPNQSQSGVLSQNNTKSETSLVQSSIQKISKHFENNEIKSNSSCISKKNAFEENISRLETCEENHHKLENDVNFSCKSNLLEQDITITEKNKNTVTQRAQYYSSTHSNSSKSSCQNLSDQGKDLNGQGVLESRGISPEFLDKIRHQILSDKVVHKSGKSNISKELRKTQSLGSHYLSHDTNERRWSVNSCKQETRMQQSSEVGSSKSRLLVTNADENFKSELNNKLKKMSISNFNNHEPVAEQKSMANGRDITDNVQDSVSEEPIYWEIDDIPNKNLKDTINNNQSNDSSSQVGRELEDKPAAVWVDHIDEKDFPSDLSDLSDGSDLSDSSWSDMESEATPNLPQKSTLHCLVKATLGITENILQNNASVSRNDSNRTHQDGTNSNSKRISSRKNSKVKRSASDRSTKSRQEDVESIGSNSTEGSYSMSKKLSSWFPSIGKGSSKRSSLFYCESSPDQSLLYQNTSVSSEMKDEDDSRVHSVCYPPMPSVSSNIQDSVPLSPEEIAEKRKRKAFLVAQEVMTSEKVFVDVLSLLSKDMKEQCRSDIPEVELDKVITPLPQLLCLNEDLLKDIEDRINHWDTLPKISDIFVKKGPFLKLYSSYIQNFQTQCNFLDDCCSKYPLFNKKLKEFEMSELCKKLSVKHYMLKPIQRIPQYRLLLEDYLKQLEPESVDYEDTQKALQIVCNVADHANKSMKQGDNLCKLLQIQSQLGNYEIIKPGRVFIKEGELYKLSRRGLQERFFILLSDCLLYTSYYGTVTGLRVNYELPLNGMKVCLPQTEDYNNEFSVIAISRSFTLRARSANERLEWIDAVQTAIKENEQHLLSFLNRRSLTQSSIPELNLGKVAPLWIPDSRVSMCQRCTSVFTVTFRRHHCRACGKVVCGPCSDYLAPLEYKKFRNFRVCEECYHYLVQEFDDEDSNMFERVKAVANVEDNHQVTNMMDIIRSNFKEMGTAGRRKPSKKYRKYVPQRLIEVTANDSGSQHSGWLHKKSGRNWKRYWFVLKDQVMYKYKASEDIKALLSIPVLGYELEALNEQDNFKYVFQLKHQGQDPLVFGADNEQSYERWMKAMREATTLN